MSSYSLGIDIGGTFTDIVVYVHESGRCLSHKELTTPDAPSRGAITGVRRLFEREGLDFASVVRVVHATTLFTNALIERKGAPTGLITTAGFRDTMEIARENKYELYDLHIELPRTLIPRRLRLEAVERLGPDGTVETALDEADLLAQVGRLKEQGVESVAVVFLHAYANPVHEQRARQLIEQHHPGLFVSISSEVSPQIREYERTITTTANAYIKPLADGYLELMAGQIRALGVQAPLFMMLSNGGLTHIEEAKRVPIQLLESGPAAGALVAAFFGRQAEIANLLAFDMGGTTAKLAIVQDHEPLVVHKFEASREKRLTEGSGLPLSISTVELIEIGAGGGSIAHRDQLGLLKVGPLSAGSSPGPACYGRGGEQPTVSDANLVLGFLDPATFAGGTMAISEDKARQALAPLAAQLGVSVPECAWGIYSIINENMAVAARVHIAECGHFSGDFSLLVTGGGGPLHGCEVARRLGVSRVICPPSAGVASALGLLVAPARIDRMATVSRRLSRTDWDELESTYRALEAEASAVIGQTLPGQAKDIALERAADMRFVGQGFEIVTTLPPGPYGRDCEAALRDCFTAAYRRTFGEVLPVSDVEFVNIRVVARTPAGSGDLDAGPRQGAALPEPTVRKVWLAAGKDYADVPAYDRAAMPAGLSLQGPALVQDASSTLILPPDGRLVVEGNGSLVIDLDLKGGQAVQASVSAAAHTRKEAVA